LPGGALLAGLVGVLLAGCATESSKPPTATASTGLSPILQRMRKTYEDLSSGRFVSLADFETPTQVTLFRCVGPDDVEGDRPQPTLSILRSRSETGAGGLKALLRSPDDRLVLDGRRSSELALVRNWQPYSLLLMSVYGPADGVLLELTISSGQAAPLHWTRNLRVQRGWSLHRIDLADVGDWIDLADVRSVSWRAPQATGPVEVYLDDIILADNTRVVLGELPAWLTAGRRTMVPVPISEPPSAEAEKVKQPGSLYVFTRGRRIYVGAHQRFELAYSGGQIVAWHGTAGENLVDVGGLGPWPVPLPEDWQSRLPPFAYDDPGLFAGWGEIVASNQRVVEATPFRVVIVGEWQFGTRPETRASSDDFVGHRWSYTIYPWGAIYVLLHAQAAPVGWSRPRVGLALGLDGRCGFRQVVSLPGGAKPQPEPFVLQARGGDGQADLLWTWSLDNDLAGQLAVASADGRRAAVIVGDLPAAPKLTVAQMLRIWPTDIDGAPEALSLVADYRHPAQLHVSAGRVVADVPGDLDGDGYNEAEGCYELAPAGGALRFEFAPGALVRFDPVFRVHETAGRRCWVYARGRPVESIGRDRVGNLLFYISHALATPLAIEVHVAAEAAAAP